MPLIFVGALVSSCGARSQNPGARITSQGFRIKVGAAPASVAIGDFDRDGKLDLAVANSGSRNVSILLGNGRGEFTQAAGSPFYAGDNPSDIALGDVNGDGNLDLAFANHDTSYLTVLIGDAKGGFGPAPGSPFAVQSKPHPHGVVMADFNGDGKPDLATDDWQNNRITVLFNDGKGRFLSPGVSFPVGRMPYHKLRTADVNKDGRPDIVTTNFEGGNVTILLADGKGRFRQPIGSPFMSILLGAGDGTFRLSWSQTAPGKAPTTAAVGDVNGDGIDDVVFGNYVNNSVTVVLGNRREFTIAPGSPFPVGSHPSSVAVGDLNGDGKADIVTANTEDDDISVLLTK